MKISSSNGKKLNHLKFADDDKISDSEELEARLAERARQSEVVDLKAHYIKTKQ